MSVEFRVELSRPLDLAGSLELFRRSGDDLIDRWDGTRLVRALPVDGVWVPFVATATETGFRVVVDNPRFVNKVREGVETTFFAAPDDYRRLVREDPIVAAVDARFPGIRQIRQLDLFTALVRCISAQQVNLRWAATTRRRLAEAFGERHAVDGTVVYSLDPRRIAVVDPADIRALQFTTSKSIAIVAVARVLAEGRLSVETLAPLSDEDVIARLVAIRGIGRWSAEWVLARTLGRPRVVAGDLGVRKAVGLAYLNDPAPSEAQVRDVTAHWGDAAGVAQALLLHALGEGAFNLSLPRRPVSPAASQP